MSRYIYYIVHDVRDISTEDWKKEPPLTSAGLARWWVFVALKPLNLRNLLFNEF